MTPSPNPPPKQQNSFFWSLGFPLILCVLGTAGILLFLHQKDQWNRTAEQTRIDLRHIPPELIGYRQTAVFATPVPGMPTSFALLNDSTFVVGSADPTMLSLFDETGALLRTIKLPDTPLAIACGTPNTLFTGKIVVAFPRVSAVYDTEGNRETSWEQPGQEYRSLALTPTHVFAVCSRNRIAHRFDATGKYKNMFGNLNHPNRYLGFDGFIVFAAPITMTFSPKSDLLYIANPGKHRVDVFTQDGTYQPKLGWGEPSGKLEGFAACCNPIGLAVLEDGRILTVEKGISRIKIYRTDGTLDTVVAGPDVLDNPPPEIARTPIEPGGRYFSAVPLSDGRIAVFDFEGFIRIFAAK